MTGIRNRRGFTLVELLIALAIVGALLAIAFGGLRVAIRAWQQGEDRAEAHQHVRSIAMILARAVSATYPYRASRGEGPDPVVLFAGTDKRLEFVTQAVPFAGPTPIAFTAVVLELDESGEPGLAIRQRPLPNREPFTKAEVVYRDTSVTTLKFEYLDEGAWRDSWDAGETRNMPRAVKVTVGARMNGRTEELPPITVALRTTVPQ
jgi:general secretion pathway protein J